MTISDLCINRPVFTWVLVAIPVVLGLVSYNELGVDLFPNVDFPVVHGHDGAPGCQRRGDGNDGHQADRGHHQHGLGHRRAALDHAGRRLDRHRPVPAVQERRRGNAGGPRQGQHDPVATCPTARDRRSSTSSTPASMPVMTIAVSGRRDFREVTEIARKQIKERLETVPGVGADQPGGRPCRGP